MSEQEKNHNKEDKKGLSHIVGAYVIDAMPSFLNGAGISKRKEDRNVTILKKFYDGNGETLFVSAPSLRYWWTHTILEETGWKESIVRALDVNKDGNTSKTSTELDPVIYFKDNAFGYLKTAKGQGKLAQVEDTEDMSAEAEEAGNTEAEEIEIEATNGNGTKAETETNTTRKGTRVKTLARTSPLATSILVGLRKTGWKGRVENYVALTEGTPLPYTTEFANTPLTGIFSLDYNRISKFKNVGDRIELDEGLVKKYLKNGMIKPLDEKPEYYSIEKVGSGSATSKKKQGDVYETANAVQQRKEITTALLKSLAVLRGGAKQAAFGTDVAPKVMIIAGLTTGNPIFNTLFEDDNSGTNRGKTVSIDVEALKQIVDDYADRIVTPS